MLLQYYKKKIKISNKTKFILKNLFKLKKIKRKLKLKVRYNSIVKSQNQILIKVKQQPHTKMEFHQKYTILQQLPTSSNQDMYKAKRNSDSKIFMLKKVHYSKLQQKEKQQIVQQVNILTEFNSNSIVKYCEHFVQKTENTLYVVMEYEPVDLLQVMRKYQDEGKYFSEEKVWKLMKDLVLALKDIHKNKKGVILHRNIQPKSVFINNNSIKLGNFKFVKKLDTEEQFATTILTDTYYMSPEQLQQGVFTPKTDVWALGCLLYEICTFTNPFQGNSIFEIGNKVREGKIKPLPSIYKKQLNRVIRWCLTKDSRDRPSVEDLLGIPMINLLIRQNRLTEVGKKITEKQNKNFSLEQEIIQLQQKLLQLKSEDSQRSKTSGSQILTKESFSKELERKQSSIEVGYKKFEDLKLRKGLSQKISQKQNCLRNTSSSITQLSNYTSTCQRIYTSKMKQSLIKPEDIAYRQLNF